MSYILIPFHILSGFFVQIFLFLPPFWTLLAIIMMLIMLLLWKTTGSKNRLVFWFPILLFQSCTFSFEFVEISCLFETLTKYFFQVQAAAPISKRELERTTWTFLYTLATHVFLANNAWFYNSLLEL